MLPLGLLQQVIKPSWGVSLNQREGLIKILPVCKGPVMISAAKMKTNDIQKALTGVGPI